MSEPLTDVDVRVLGALIEKERTTPDYYPLTLNALVNACNQTSNREPVVKYDEGTVAHSVEALRHRGLIRGSRGIDARVTKFAHRLSDMMSVDKRELAILCVLMLRGAQTTGEIRTRTARMEEFDDLGDVETLLDALIIKEYVVRLPRQPGQKEVRYTHLLSGAEAAAEQGASQPFVSRSTNPDRIAALEENVEELRKELTELRTQMEAFRAQFE